MVRRGPGRVHQHANAGAARAADTLSCATRQAWYGVFKKLSSGAWQGVQKSAVVQKIEAVSGKNIKYFFKITLLCKIVII